MILRTLKLELPYGPVSPLVGIYPGKTTVQKDTCTSIIVLTAALFTIAKTRRKPKCPVTDEWIRKMWYI